MSNSIEKIINPIDIDESYDFCAIIISSYHLSFLYAYLTRLREQKNRNLKGIVIITYQIVNGEKRIRIDENVIKDFYGIKINYYLNDGAFVKQKSNISQLLNFLRIHNQSKKQIILISPLRYSYAWCHYFSFCDRRKIILCKIDEGLGTYYYSRIFGWYFIESGKSIKKLFITISRNLFYEMVLFMLMSKKVSFENFFLYTKKRNKLIPDKECGKYVTKIVCNTNINTEYEMNSVLLIKDFDIEVVNEEDSIVFYSKIIQDIRKYTNKKIYIKRHPSDLNNNFKNIIQSRNSNVEIIDSKIGVEDFYEIIKPVAIFAGFSTSAFSINVLFNTTIINYSLLYFDYKILNDYFKFIIRKNYKCFKYIDSIIFIKSFEQKEYCKLLNGIFNKQE